MAIFWWIGLAVLLKFSWKVMMTLLMKRGWTFWTGSIEKALQPTQSGTRPTILLYFGPNYTGENGTDETCFTLLREVANRWPENPVRILASDAEWKSVTEFPDVGLFISWPSSPKGVAGAAAFDCGQLDPASVSKLVDVRLRAPMLITRLCLRGMIARKSGAVLIAGGSADDQHRHSSAWGCEAMRSFTESLQAELRADNIVVQSVQDKSVSEALQNLTCGSASWIFPLGYTPSFITSARRSATSAFSVF